MESLAKFMAFWANSWTICAFCALFPPGGGGGCWITADDEDDDNDVVVGVGGVGFEYSKSRFFSWTKSTRYL